jgi:hypothetical protein
MKHLWLTLVLLAPMQARAQVPPGVPLPAPPNAGDMPKGDDVPPPVPMDEAPPAPPPEEAPAPPKEKEPKKQDISPPDAWVPRTQATLRVMNKIDSTVQTLSVPVGGSTTYQSLTIKLSGCFVRPPDLPDDATAHLTITDSRPDQPGFDAWMLKNEPALNMLQHPVYDVQLAGCG